MPGEEGAGDRPARRERPPKDELHYVTGPKILSQLRMLDRGNANAQRRAEKDSGQPILGWLSACGSRGENQEHDRHAHLNG